MIASAEAFARARIEAAWPADGLERVDACPYCASPARTLAHHAVRDWSFYAAPGAWDYWMCDACESLYLDPRPTAAALHLAYSTYYTHTERNGILVADRVRARIRNEAFAAFIGVELGPRLNLPRWLRWIMEPLRNRLSAPFHIQELARLSPGRLLDVGCGNGYMLDVASKLGWDARGLEFDPVAVRTATARGLNVEQGGYERLGEFAASLDCVLCSHVLEHVAEPRELLRLAAGALRDGGVLLLALPNATSIMRSRFGDNWRGLEAPRHLTIPSAHQLAIVLDEVGFAPAQRQGRGAWTATAAESLRIARRGMVPGRQDVAAAGAIEVASSEATMRGCDFSEFVCVKRGTGG